MLQSAENSNLFSMLKFRLLLRKSSLINAKGPQAFANSCRPTQKARSHPQKIETSAQDAEGLRKQLPVLLFVRRFHLVPGLSASQTLKPFICRVVLNVGYVVDNVCPRAPKKPGDCRKSRMANLRLSAIR